MADYERSIPTSYVWLIVSFAPSSTVSELLVIYCGPEMTSCQFSARGRLGLNLMVDSERPTPTSYLWLIVSFAPSNTVSELLVIYCGPEMTSCQFLRYGASRVELNGGF